MIGTKKKSLLVILSLVMVLTLACSAWALRTTTLSAGAGQDLTATEDIDVTDANGIYAVNGGKVTNPGFNVKTLNTSTTTGNAIGVYALNSGVISMVGNIETAGYRAFGAQANGNASATSIDLRGNVTTTGDYAAGVYSLNHDSYLSADGNITTSGYGAYGGSAINARLYINGAVKTSGEQALGVSVGNNGKAYINGTITTSGCDANGLHVSGTSGYAKMNGNIETTNDKSLGFVVRGTSSADLTGNVTTSGSESNGVSVENNSSATVAGDITTTGEKADGASVINNSTLNVTGNVTINGENAYGLNADDNSKIDMKDGAITIADDSSAGIVVNRDGEVNLSNVDADSPTLISTTSNGVLNAEDSTLVGDVINGGLGGTAGTLEVNLKDSTLEGAILASEGIGGQTGGTVDLDLENSTWLITGDSNTNGKVTGDIDSVIDYTEAPGETTVTIDEIVGNPTITLKPGDGLNITNSTGNNSNFSSSNPDVLEVVTDPDTGAVSIISKGEGDADLTYTYTAPNGSKHTVTVDGSSADPHGTGSTPGSSRSGGSSSGCNAGFGALFALLGLAIVAKKK